MTPERQAVITAQNALFEAQDKVDEEQAKMIVVNQAMVDAQKFYDVVLPVQQQQEKAQAVANIVTTQHANAAQFEITQAAYVARDAAQRALQNAIIAASNAGAVSIA